VLVGAPSTTQIFTVTNIGGAASGFMTTSISGTAAADYQVTADTCNAGTLAAGATCQVTVQLTPSAPGARGATLGVSATPGGASSATLTGTGFTSALLSMNPTSADFGSTAVGSTSSAQMLTITNTGGSPSGMMSTSITGVDAADFANVADTCHNQVLGAGQQCQVTIEFAPSSDGAKNATLSVSATPGGAPSAALSGTGLLTYAVRVDLDYLSSVATGGVAGGTVTFRLNGTETKTTVISGTTPDVTDDQGNGIYTFSTQLPTSAAYTVEILSQTTGQYCWLRDAIGTVGTSDVTVLARCTLIYTASRGTDFATASQTYVSMGLSSDVKLSQASTVFITAHVPYVDGGGGPGTKHQAWLRVRDTTTAATLADYMAQGQYWTRLGPMNLTTAVSLAAGNRTLALEARKGANNISGVPVSFTRSGYPFSPYAGSSSNITFTITVLESLELFLDGEATLQAFETVAPAWTRVRTQIGRTISVPPTTGDLGPGAITVMPTTPTYYLSFLSVPIVGNFEDDGLVIQRENGAAVLQSWSDFHITSRGGAVGDQQFRYVGGQALGLDSLPPGTHVFKFKYWDYNYAPTPVYFYDASNGQTTAAIQSGVLPFRATGGKIFTSKATTTQAMSPLNEWVAVGGLSAQSVTVAANQSKRVLLDLRISSPYPLGEVVASAGMRIRQGASTVACIASDAFATTDTNWQSLQCTDIVTLAGGGTGATYTFTPEYYVEGRTRNGYALQGHGASFSVIDLE
jgi:hypothetical protein